MSTFPNSPGDYCRKGVPLMSDTASDLATDWTKPRLSTTYTLKSIRLDYASSYEVYSKIPMAMALYRCHDVTRSGCSPGMCTESSPLRTKICTAPIGGVGEQYVWLESWHRHQLVSVIEVLTVAGPAPVYTYRDVILQTRKAVSVDCEHSRSCCSNDTVSADGLVPKFCEDAHSSDGLPQISKPRSI